MWNCVYADRKFYQFSIFRSTHPSVLCTVVPLCEERNVSVQSAGEQPLLDAICLINVPLLKLILHCPNCINYFWNTCFKVLAAQNKHTYIVSNEIKDLTGTGNRGRYRRAGSAENNAIIIYCAPTDKKWIYQNNATNLKLLLSELVGCITEVKCFPTGKWRKSGYIFVKDSHKWIRINMSTESKDYFHTRWALSTWHATTAVRHQHGVLARREAEWDVPVLAWTSKSPIHWSEVKLPNYFVSERQNNC
jgi:hypothetical protein